MTHGNQSSQIFAVTSQTIKKLLLSLFVISSFVVYAIRDRLDNSNVTTTLTLTPSVRTQPETTSVQAASSNGNENAEKADGITLTSASGDPVIPQTSPSDSGAAGEQNNSLSPSTVPSGATTQQNTVPPTVPPIPTLAPTPIPTVNASPYRDGQFTGDVTDAYWGNVQVEAVIQQGKITDVQFLDYPHDRRTSQFINSQAMPWLMQEAIQAQSANVNIISGATLTSEAFIQSLQSALTRARNVT
jgi:uncharacterized protein with FMN-binding domain